MSNKPVPVPDSETTPFWEAAAQGVLKVQRCTGCGEHVFYPRVVCPSCLSDDLQWVSVSGRATVHAVTVVHRAAAPFKEDLPYAVALVDLAEGPRMMTQILTDAPEKLAIGDAVEVEFRRQGEGPPLPFFRPV
ncbi:Zn-ribbon domain-containing OB-fold protein [Chelativorans sp. YIM 93263]|uniref:Zn-ribbon domain-containing OB-fold protein n=1 Tax=Chelativorans sp. YIM 93263 TaxID=2906648 RepID=UPI002378E558|nr:Zn-ribbon domain-containing OB-fold protein [Chelativorans sp. YIM 93263]